MHATFNSRDEAVSAGYGHVDYVAIEKDKFYWLFTKINNIKTKLVIRNFFRIAGKIITKAFQNRKPPATCNKHANRRGNSTF